MGGGGGGGRGRVAAPVTPAAPPAPPPRIDNPVLSYIQPEMPRFENRPMGGPSDAFQQVREYQAAQRAANAPAPVAPTAAPVAAPQYSGPVPSGMQFAGMTPTGPKFVPMQGQQGYMNSKGGGEAMNPGGSSLSGAITNATNNVGNNLGNNPFAVSGRQYAGPESREQRSAGLAGLGSGFTGGKS